MSSLSAFKKTLDRFLPAVHDPGSRVYVGKGETTRRWHDAVTARERSSGAPTADGAPPSALKAVAAVAGSSSMGEPVAK